MWKYITRVSRNRFRRNGRCRIFMLVVQSRRRTPGAVPVFLRGERFLDVFRRRFLALPVNHRLVGCCAGGWRAYRHEWRRGWRRDESTRPGELFFWSLAPRNIRITSSSCASYWRNNSIMPRHRGVVALKRWRGRLVTRSSCSSLAVRSSIGLGFVLRTKPRFFFGCRQRFARRRINKPTRKRRGLGPIWTVLL